MKKLLSALYRRAHGASIVPPKPGAEIVVGAQGCADETVAAVCTTDLGRLPERIRRIAGFWGGSAAGARAIFDLARSNGRTHNIEQLRSEIRRIPDIVSRDALLSWLDGPHRSKPPSDGL